ncbi:hypothetical protein [Calidifontibacter indicus]|uniref:hypothetical protein n=1 Tax=Calidifontibacter indicus TaxID=419650 RepID=UPI003D7164C0
MSLETQPALMIQRPGPFTSLVAPATELDGVYRWVAEIALPILLAGKVGSRLPASAPMGDQGLDVRERLVAGDWTRAKVRLEDLMRERLAVAQAAGWTFPDVVDDPEPGDDPDSR